ncbi:MAG: hypothetical protein GY802_02060 [Gammaproteobacteria bacterium]|nr:hypothetical protein [Gammaproteobacteria bacterium]
MNKSVSKWINFLYGPFFRVIGFFYRSYQTNRARIARFKANAKLSEFLKIMAMLILVGWILVWFSPLIESRSRLNDDIKQTIGGFGSEFSQ